MNVVKLVKLATLRYFAVSLLLIMFLSTGAFAQNSTKEYFQQEVNTTIDVTLDDKSHRLEGNIQIEYINNSPDEISELFIHLWANAYKDRTTAFAKQQIRNKSTKFHFAEEEDRGNFEGIAFNVDGKLLKHSYYNGNQDIAYFKLPTPLKPGASLTISTPLNLDIPASFSRLGHVGESYQMTQWFPKPAVYDRDGWHPMPYLNMGEFYSEFGSYDVTITLPENYVIASTGQLRTDSELAFIDQKVEETTLNAQDTIEDLSFPESSTTFKTVNYTAENVHDFGWFADKRFHVEKGSVVLSNGKSVETYVYYTDTEKKMWQDALGYVDRSVEFYSEKVGNYPYPHATAVQSALSAGGGMEYPMITVIGTMGNPRSLDGVITHEVGHNWFYGILGFNERDHAWLDEGINSYYDHRYDQKYYGNKNTMGLPKRLVNGSNMTGMQFALMAQIKRGQDQPPSLHAADFESTNYFFSCYEKPALAFEFLEEYLGAEEFDRIMHSLYTQWEFKHPGPDDVINHFTKESGKDLSWFFNGYIYSTKEVNYKLAGIASQKDDYSLKVINQGDINSPFPVTAYKDGKAAETVWYEPKAKRATYSFPKGDYDYFVIDSSFAMLDINMDNNFRNTSGVVTPKIGFITGADNPKKRQLFVVPLLAFNDYDKLMLGANVHNLSLPFPRWKASLSTMYGFGSNRPVGMARIQYDQAVKKGKLERITYKLFAKQFSLGTANVADNTRYGTIVPSIAMHFVHGPGSIWQSKLQLQQTFARVSNDFSFAPDTEPAPTDFMYTDLSYNLTKASPLTPMYAEIGVEYMDYESIFPRSGTGDRDRNAVKVDLALKQSYAYMKGKSVHARIHAGFFPLNSETSTTTSNRNPYNNNNLNLVYNGQADHAFDDYFFGRQSQTGFYANQVKIKDGGFKLGGIDASGIGQSDRAVYAINLSTEIPKLPKYIQLYFDYGGFLQNKQTSSERAWNSLYSGGLMLNFFDAVNVYVPVINSDNIKSAQSGTNFFSKITFSIDMDKIDFIDLYNNFRI